MRILSTINLPQRLAVIREHAFEVRVGAVADAEPLNADILLCSISTARHRGVQHAWCTWRCCRGCRDAPHTRRCAPRDGVDIADSHGRMEEWLPTQLLGLGLRFLNREVLALTKPEAIIVNIGRGDMVDDEALIACLREQRNFAAGLDVFDNEPCIHPGY